MWTHAGEPDADWYARNLKLRGGMLASLSGTLATMGPGVPYALGAKFAHPGRPVIALVGDGAMQMKSVTEAVLKGDPEAFHLLAQGVKTKLRELRR